ncbi:MAG: hypothetical protein IT514_10630 [Burkholderiales bacterium]|nr:hypothetical protein [Burkholderiales bacterium]
MLGLLPLTGLADVETARARGLAWLLTNQRGDGSWAALPSLAVQSTAAAIEAYRNAGIQNGTSLAASLSWMGAATPHSVDGKARQLRVFQFPATNIGQMAGGLVRSRNAYETWGSLPGYGTNVADTALALQSLWD